MVKKGIAAINPWSGLYICIEKYIANYLFGLDYELDLILACMILCDACSLKP